MNKELIKKYKAEFDHWLNNGEDSILVDIDDSFNWDSPVSYVFDTNEFNCRITNVIINDEYVEFRKALAEGKVVQFLNTEDRLYDSSKKLNTWYDTDSIFTHGRISDYRIKPEEPKFKVDDWVYRGNMLFKITNFGILDEVELAIFCGHSAPIDELILWQPQPGEWCWFWDISTLNNKYRFPPKLGQYGRYDFSPDYYNYCEPFIGELPTNLKGL